MEKQRKYLDQMENFHAFFKGRQNHVTAGVEFLFCNVVVISACFELEKHHVSLVSGQWLPLPNHFRGGHQEEQPGAGFQHHGRPGSPPPLHQPDQDQEGVPPSARLGVRSAQTRGRHSQSG